MNTNEQININIMKSLSIFAEVTGPERMLLATLGHSMANFKAFSEVADVSELRSAITPDMITVWRQHWPDLRNFLDEVLK